MPRGSINFLAEAREKAGQLRAIIKLPAREPQAFREKLVLILELIRGIHARAQRLPLPSVCERAERFEAALNSLRDKQTLSGNDFLPLAVKLDDLLSHLAIQGEVVSRLREWRVQNGAHFFRGIRRHATFGHRHGYHHSPAATSRPRLFLDHGFAARGCHAKDRAPFRPVAESLVEMATFLADMYAKRVSLVVVGLEEVPRGYRRAIEKILGSAHPQRDSPRGRSALRARGSGQTGNRYRGRAVRARGRRRLSTQRAGRRPRPRPRQDTRRGRAPRRAYGGGSRQPSIPASSPASSSVRASPPSVKARVVSGWTWCATS